MYNTYTFLIYLFFLTQNFNIESFLLDLSKTVNYSNGNIKVAVVKIENIYNHKFEKPVFLKEIYNGDHKLHFESLLTNVHPLVSASVLLDSNEPIVLQLNLEKSSIVLLNDDTNLIIQAIFSERIFENLTIENHLESEKEVDVDLSKNEDYQSNSFNVHVTLLKISDPRFKRFGLKYYNLESNKLGKIKYNNEELKTKVGIEEEVGTGTGQNNVKKKVTLEIPYKEKVYGVYVYYYYNYPLMLEILYSFNKRSFYAYTPTDKWHKIYLPSYNDPSYYDFLFKKLNYYSCINKYKLTIDISIKTDTPGYYYLFNNYCLGPDGVENFEIKILLPFYTDLQSMRYRCYEHTPDNKNKFHVDYLMNNNSVLQLQDVPDFIDHIKVYQNVYKPFLIVFVTPSKSKHYYVYKDKAWISYNFQDESSPNGYRYPPKLRELLDG